MEMSNVVAGLIFIPRKHQHLGNVSMYNLLKETDYFKAHDQITEASIHEELSKHPECIDEWMRYSEDKRTSSGWYFKQEDEGTYIVGYFADEKGKSIKLKFTDRIEACAAFIKRELESIRQTA